MIGDELLTNISKFKWDTIARTFGNNHATLIGLLVDWWIALDCDHHTALEGGPTNGLKNKGERGQCDALLCKSDIPVGVLEVEGTRKVRTVKKLATFFEARYPELNSLEFAILFFYAYKPEGRGQHRMFEPAAPRGIINEIVDVSRIHRDKYILILTLEKEYKKIDAGIRAKNEYYMGAPSIVEAHLFLGGNEREHCELYRKNAS